MRIAIIKHNKVHNIIEADIEFAESLGVDYHVLTKGSAVGINDEYIDGKFQKHIDDYAKKRRESYPDIGDQLDAIYMHFNMVRMQGGNLAEPTDVMLNEILQVKQKYPKPTETKDA